LKSPIRAWYPVVMLKAYVGVMSKDGLAVLQPERDETLARVRNSVRRECGEVGFWAVIDDAEVQCVRALCVDGLCREAMLFLDRSAREMGPLLPSDPEPSVH
jgi:hypothetical protein